ncbi:TetR/AcrR family transcriptional regulator [Roseisalinus antarcticus]|uniref:HTH-type transcriptional repressor NicS n=1 Tax=Roseisalinus antarcticus TaxID=254357 RepID=A0A1Y5TIC7_9RHOB|nr:TetR/AcrR family transcriptional regulator [Roseisalinus antarcticus]SLN61029.1 HTH-type transcriptional repressor NicS [Roseisalinus antarcticus]
MAGRKEELSGKPKPRKRDASRSRGLILQAALEEFSEHGHSGARVDRISRRAGVSKPLIYDYFGDKDAIYAAALKESYVQIRQAESELDFDSVDPEEAIRKLVRFTLGHFREKPWFIAMLNTENLRGGSTIRTLEDAAGVQSVLLQRLTEILRRGADQGVFRDNVDPRDFYVSIASLCWFPVSNRFTLASVFGLEMDDEWYAQRAETAAEMLVAHLKNPA